MYFANPDVIGMTAQRSDIFEKSSLAISAYMITIISYNRSFNLCNWVSTKCLLLTSHTCGIQNIVVQVKVSLWSQFSKWNQQSTNCASGLLEVCGIYSVAHICDDSMFIHNGRRIRWECANMVISGGKLG